MSLHSIFTSAPAPLRFEPLPNIIHKIREGFVREPVALVRRYMDRQSQFSARQILATLPQFSPSGYFSTERTLENLTAYSQLVLLETCFLPTELIQPYRQIIELNPYTHACFLSATGDTLRILVRISTTAGLHPVAHHQVTAMFENATGIKMLNAPGCLLSLCRFTHDPLACFNPESAVYYPKIVAAPAPVVKTRSGKPPVRRPHPAQIRH